MPKQIKLIYVFDLLEKGIDIKKIASLVEQKVWIMDTFGRNVRVAKDEIKNTVLNELKKFTFYSDSPYESDIDKTGLFELLYQWREADNTILDHPFANAGWPPELLEQKKLELSETENIASQIEGNKVKEITSLQKMVLGMAISKYGYDPEASKNECTGNNKFSIREDLYKCNIDLSLDTIRKHLKEAAGNIPHKVHKNKTKPN
ncbi:MAG: hypothetical protein KC493_11270 [Bacteriovoracaceae bacterium]|nr:hypothetical protein [Bacteriovoracaceae bacterium]